MPDSPQLEDSLHRNSMPACYSFCDYSFDPTDLTLRRDGSEVPLTPTLAQILLTLVESAGRIVSKEDLLERVWPDRVVEEGNLARNISFLRKTLGDSSKEPTFIETLPRRGYRFIAPLERVSKNRDELVAKINAGPLAQHHTSRRSWVAWAGAAAAAVAVMGANRTLSQPERRIRSLAVIPFQSATEDEFGRVLASGIASTLSADLGSIESLRVIAWNASKRWDSNYSSLQQLARENGVDAIIDGSVADSDGEVQVQVRILDVASGESRWSEGFKRSDSAIRSLQSEIVLTVAKRVNAPVTGDEERRLAGRARSINPDAHESYLKGLYAREQGGRNSARLALQWFERALQKDPIFAPAYAAMADCYLRLGSWDGQSVELWPEARRYAAQALKLDASIAEAHLVCAGVTLCYDYNREAAGQGFLDTLRLDPGSSTAWRRYGYCLTSLGRWKEGVEVNRKALDLDPASASNPFYIGRALYYGRQYREAAQWLEDLVQLRPEYALASRARALVDLATGNYERAVRSLTKVVARGVSHQALGELAFAYGVSGHRAEAREMILRLKQGASDRNERHAYNLALAYTGLGEGDRAIEILPQVYRERDYRLVFARVDPAWDALRDRADFDSFLDGIGLRQQS